MLGTFLEQQMACRSQQGTVGLQVFPESSIRQFQHVLDASAGLKLYQCDMELLLPWVTRQVWASMKIPPCCHLLVLMRACDAQGLAAHAYKDIAAINLFVLKHQQEHRHTLGVLLIPDDFNALPVEEQDTLLTFARMKNVYVMICPIAKADLDKLI